MKTTKSFHKGSNQLSPKSLDNLTTDRVACRLYETVGTPVALSCHILLRYGELEQLVQKRVDPLNYDSASAFADDFLAVSFLSKYKDFRLSINRKDEAMKKFNDAERQCKATNARFRGRSSGVFSTPDVESVLFRSQQKIERILGPLKRSVLLRSAFGPGVTNSCTGDRTGVAEKFKSELYATRDALKYVKPLLGMSPLWAKALANVELIDEAGVPAPDFCDFPCETVPYNSVTFVPKSAVIDRAIAIEPHLNVFFQKGVGGHIRDRLKRFGTDLNDQTRNQELARVGSRDGSLATIDLAAASDTVAVELVWSLLPYDWACFLDDLRSKYGRKPDGTTIRYEKWSSMGNGYTFELESLIFHAIVSACNEQLGLDDEFSVYGDDIICKSEAFDLVHRVLDYCGFTLNERKSFSSGSFRESCGKDWFLGTYVRPFFLKEKVRSLTQLYGIANAVRLYASNRNHGFGCDSKFEGLWRWLYHSVAQSQRVVVPRQFGDVGFIGNFDEACPSTVRRPRAQWIEGIEVRVLLSTPNQYRLRNDAASLIQALLIGHDTPTGGLSTIRRSVSYSRKFILANYWQDLGAWI